MSWLGGQKDTSKGRSGIVTVLDVGSSKVCCIVARLRPRGERKPMRAFSFLEVEGEEDPAETVDLAKLAKERPTK